MPVSMLSATQTNQECRLKVLEISRIEYSRTKLLISPHLIRNEKALPTLTGCRVGCILPTFLRLAKELCSDH